MHPRALLDSLDIGVAAIGSDGTVTEWTETAARITGVPAAGMVGRELWVAFPAARGGHVEETFRDVRLDGVARTCLYPADAGPAGAAFELRVTLGPDGQLVIGFRRVFEILSPQTRAAQLLSAFEVERRLYMQLFATLPVPAFVLDAAGAILQANAGAAELLGAGNFVGTTLADHVAPSHRLAFDVALREARHRPQQLSLVLEVPRVGHQEARAVLLNVDPQAEPARLLFIAVETSREALLQKKLLQSDRLAQLGALVAGVAHELSNPLAAIAAFAENLAIDAREAELKESAQIIRAEAMRAGRIVGTLLDFARQRPRVTQPLDVADAVHRVLALERNALRKAGIKASLTLDPDLPVVIGDPQELQQVLLNAVVNARQAIAAAGRPGTITISARATDSRLLIRVDDTGPGIPVAALERVFEPFFTTKGEAGSGLGLAISAGLVRSMGGRMWVQNIDSSGASLSIELPTGQTAAAEPALAAAPAPAAKRMVVLVVDDDPSVRRGMVLLAKRLGHDVDSAASVDEAVRAVTQRNHYDAMLVDVHLDEAHTGFEVFDRLANEGRGREQHIVFVTGDSISAGTRDRLERAARPVLQKPFSLDELRLVLDQLAAHEVHRAAGGERS